MPPLRWRHIILHTKSTWLHGDPRGFRDRKHRIHSSGDYKAPPPRGEHAGLHRYMLSIASPAVHLEGQRLRAIVGTHFVEHVRSQKLDIVALAVTEEHAHGLIELPNDLALIRTVMGDAKRASSRAIRKWVPGSVWAAGGKFKLIEDDEHFANVDDYILYKQGASAWTWSTRDLTVEGLFGRVKDKRAETRGAAARRTAPLYPGLGTYGF